MWWTVLYWAQKTFSLSYRDVAPINIELLYSVGLHVPSENRATKMKRTAWFNKLEMSHGLSE